MNGKKQGLPMGALIALLASALLGGAASDALAWATITVNTLADPGASGVCALRDAITAANTHTPTNGCIAGKGNDTIQFSVIGTILLADMLPEVTDNQLTISGPITIDGGSKVGVMQVASAAALSLKKVMISNGGNPNTDSVTVGGIFNQGTLTISAGTFSDNSGGFNLHSPALFNQSVLNVISTTFLRNTGSAIDNTGTLTVTNSIFLGNRGAGPGGIGNSGIANVTNSTFSNNIGGANSFLGAGAIQNENGKLTVTNSTFSGNAAQARGGAIWNNGNGEMTIMNCTFSDNGSGEFGGAVSSSFGGTPELTIADSTFSGNSAQIGGGAIDMELGTASISNSTFAGNNSPGDFGGPGGGNILAFAGASATLRGTLLAGLSGTSNCVGTITDLGYNISDDDSCGFTAVGSLNNTDPMLSPAGLADNGGPTQTIALLPGSPAIDAIPVSSCTDQDGNPLTTDQRGFPRPDAGEQVCDIGAYEFQDFAGTPGTKNCQGVSVLALAREFRNITAAASALHFPNVQALHKAIQAFCKA